MQALLGALILLAGGFAFGRTWSRVRAGAWAGPRTTGMRQRAARQRTVRQERRIAWDKASAVNWLEAQRHDRKNATARKGTPAAMATVTPLQRARDKARERFRGPADAPGDGGGEPAPVRPAAAPGPPQATMPTDGRTTTVAATGSAHAAEKLIEGVNQIHAEAAAGGIHAKHAAIKAATEGAMRFSSMQGMLARSMSEPGSNYGPEITEPIAKAGELLQATAMALSEADANLSTLVNMTVGDLANSARQAPHHAELSENGSSR